MSIMGLGKYILSFILALLLCGISHGQQFSSYSSLNKMAADWSNPLLFEDNNKGAPEKTIDFPAHNYRITAFFRKNRVVPGHMVVSSIDGLGPALEGQAFYNQDTLFVKGIKYDDYSASKCRATYGFFKVSNAEDGLMVYKPKKAGDLKVTECTLYYHQDYYQDCPVMMRLSPSPYIAIDGDAGGEEFTDFSAPLNPTALAQIGYNKPFELLMQSTKDVWIKWKNGAVFSGDVLLEPNENGGFSIRPITGKKIGLHNGYREIIVSENHGSIRMELIDSPMNPVMKRETLIVSDKGALPEKDYWDALKFYEKTDSVLCMYRNGNVFEGRASCKPQLNATGDLVSSDYVFENGIIRYANGDRFEGRFEENKPCEGVYYYANGDSFKGSFKNRMGNLFFDGTTFFKNGHSIKGDYLRLQTFTETQRKRLESCNSPSEAREMASVFTKANIYEVYRYAAASYFNADEECSRFDSYPKAAYRKDKKCYYILRNDLTIKMVVYTDDEGRNLKEIVYKDGFPDYTTLYTYYSNHKASSIETRWCNGERKLRCNFFSDGKIRSAYEYQKGNGGKMVLRRSKEAHPTYGGYTSKLYDLNGNYERSIKWDIDEKTWGPWITVEPKIETSNPLDPMDSGYQDIIQAVEGLGL